MKFSPPIEIRDTDELIIMVKNADDYQADAVLLAKEELSRRNISQSNLDSRYNELEEEDEKEFKETMNKKATEDYTNFEKIMMIIFWFSELRYGWGLKSEGYTTKAKKRIRLIGIGIALYLLILFISYIYEQAFHPKG